jgi:cephalosporin-C deacetylase
MKNVLSIIILFLMPFALWAQPKEQMIKVLVAPDHEDWRYALGENVKFDIKVVKNSVLLQNVDIYYEVSYDMMTPLKKKKAKLKNGTLTVNAGSMDIPGFLRCQVWAKYDGKTYKGLATAAFTPEEIKPTAVLPSDFDAFWEKAKSENAKIPLDSRLRLIPERCTGKINVYELNIQNYRMGSRIYGILCIPKAPGKYPALLRVPGAGVRPYNGMVGEAEDGMITLDIGIHGIPVTMDPVIYNNLLNGALYQYQYINWDNRDEVYFKRVYLGCIRAVDYIFSMEEFDGRNIMVYGGSQGGALAIVTAALDTRIKGLISFYPALCDLNGYVHNRAGGWPHLFRTSTDTQEVLEQKIKNTPYYDVVNFARKIKVPGFYYLGFNDMVCPPTSTYSAYNVITAPKTLEIMEEAGHFFYPELWAKVKPWLYGNLHMSQ